MFRYDDEPFIMIHSSHDAKLLNASDDLRVRKRAKTGDSWANLKKKQEFIGGMAVTE